MEDLVDRARHEDEQHQPANDRNETEADRRQPGVEDERDESGSERCHQRRIEGEALARLPCCRGVRDRKSDRRQLMNARPELREAVDEDGCTG